MEQNLLTFNLYEKTPLILMKKHRLKDKTMKENDLTRMLKTIF